MQGRPAREEEWRALAARAAGAFFYGVTTTGVFCRCGCPSRLPRPGNTRIFDSAAQSLAAGFRPCRRCLKGS